MGSFDTHLHHDGRLTQVRYLLCLLKKYAMPHVIILGIRKTNIDLLNKIP